MTYAHKKKSTTDFWTLKKKKSYTFSQKDTGGPLSKLCKVHPSLWVQSTVMYCIQQTCSTMHTHGSSVLFDCCHYYQKKRRFTVHEVIGHWSLHVICCILYGVCNLSSLLCVLNLLFWWQQEKKHNNNKTGHAVWSLLGHKSNHYSWCPISTACKHRLCNLIFHHYCLKVWG